MDVVIGAYASEPITKNRIHFVHAIYVLCIPFFPLVQTIHVCVYTSRNEFAGFALGDATIKATSNRKRVGDAHNAYFSKYEQSK